jgi:hypothetical protein
MGDLLKGRNNLRKVAPSTTKTTTGNTGMFAGSELLGRLASRRSAIDGGDESGDELSDWEDNRRRRRR